jgi:hypothetical protein
MYVEPSVQPSVNVKSAPSGNAGASGFSVFSVGTVLSLSFSTFFKHPFVFMGLCLLAQVPGFFVGLAAGETIASIVSLVLTLAIQGAISYGVYETLRGDAARFGKSLSRGMARVIPLILAVLSFFVFITLIVLGGGLLGIVLWNVVEFGAFLIFLPMLVITAWLMMQMGRVYSGLRC